MIGITYVSVLKIAKFKNKIAEQLHQQLDRISQLNIEAVNPVGT